VPLLKNDAPALVDQPGGTTDCLHRITLMRQHEAAEDGIDRLAEPDPLERLRLKGDLFEAFYQRTALCLGDVACILVRGNDATARTYALGDKQRYLRQTSSEHEDVHPGPDAGCGEQIFGERLSVGGLDCFAANSHEPILAAAGRENHEDTHIFATETSVM
jgi:hypothetical protein